MFRHLTFRPHPHPTTPLPLNVRSTGHYLLEAGARELREPGPFIQLFWCVDGTGRVRFGRTFHPLRAQTLFFYEAGERHVIEAGKGLEYRWLTLDGPRAGIVRGLFSLRRIQTSGACPETLFSRLPACLEEATSRGEHEASAIAYRILLQASSPGIAPVSSKTEDHPVLLAKAWMEDHFTDARLNVSQLALRFGLHRSTLYRLFSGRFGVTPVQYLCRLRIRHALGLLKETALPVADVAVRSGLPDIAYFSRLIRRNTGYSPRAYRQRHA